MNQVSKAAQGRVGRIAKLLGFGIIAISAATLVVACGSGGDEDEPSTTSSAGSTPAATRAPALSGSIAIDGSSTVFPITEAVAEEFIKVNKEVKVTVGLSGTGGGFEKFCNGETVISDASRPVKSTEAEKCTAKNINFIELPVAYDGLSVVVNPQNTWATCMTTAELKKLWEPEAQGKVTHWNQIRPEWPNAEIKLYGPGTDSGTFDYFTETINGKAQASRSDFVASEDDNVLVQGVAGDRNALGYFGLAYLEENANKIKGVQVDGGKGCVAPSQATVENGTYAPLSRPLFIYVRSDAASKPEVKAFVDFYMANASKLAGDVGYVKFPPAFYQKITAHWTGGKTGAPFSTAPAGSTVESVLNAPGYN